MKLRSRDKKSRKHPPPKDPLTEDDDDDITSPPLTRYRSKSSNVTSSAVKTDDGKRKRVSSKHHARRSSAAKRYNKRNKVEESTVVEPEESSDSEVSEEEASPPPKSRRHKKGSLSDDTASAAEELLAKLLIKGILGNKFQKSLDVEEENEEDEEDEEEYEEDSSDFSSSDDEFSEKNKEKAFMKSLSKKDRKTYIDAEDELRKVFSSQKPLKFQVIDSVMPESAKLRCWEFLNSIGNDDDSSDYKRKAWINSLLRVPFGKFSEGSKTDMTPVEKLEHAEKCITSVVYGNREAKCMLLQLVAQGISNPKAKPPVIGLLGPPGVGKTTLARYGISEALGKPFRQISCGGLHDASSLKGHTYTWEGSNYGAIVDAVIQSQCLDPLILLDEVDKIGNTKHGEEVQNVLLHLLDSTQNESWQDEFFSGIDFDISRAQFILSMNDTSNINPYLLDRLYIIKMDSHGVEDKINIAEHFLITKCMKNVGLRLEDITFKKDCLQHIIASCTEKGVRNLYRNIETCIRKLNMLMMISSEDIYKNLGDSNKEKTSILMKARDSGFPITIDVPLFAILKQKESGPSYPLNMYM